MASQKQKKTNQLSFNFTEKKVKVIKIDRNLTRELNDKILGFKRPSF